MKKYIGPDKILEKKSKYMFPNSHHFYRNPPQIVKGEMQYLFDSEGNRYTDFFAGVSVVNCGHCNPKIVKAAVNQLETLWHTTNIYLTEPIVKLSEKLAKVFPGDIDTSFFCLSGSEANEGALLLARLHTGKKKFMYFNGGLHGRTYLTTGVTGVDMWKIDPYYDDSFVRIDNYLLDSKMDIEEAAHKNIACLEEVLTEQSDDISALIVEPIQGNAGIIVPPKWYFKKVKEILNKYGVLLIVDEVQTGFGRTGKMFAIERFGVVPDIITCAKALGNGMPISVFASGKDIAASFNKPSASTLGGNPVASATALEVLKYIHDEKLVVSAKYLGDYLLNRLTELGKIHECISSVRGMGLMIGVEINPPSGEPAKAVDDILESMKDRGFIIGKNGIGRNVLAFQPPLVIAKSDIDDMLINLGEVLGEIDG